MEATDGLVKAIGELVAEGNERAAENTPALAQRDPYWPLTAVVGHFPPCGRDPAEGLGGASTAVYSPTKDQLRPRRSLRPVTLEIALKHW